METNLLNSKKSKFGIYEVALATLLFVIYNFIFIELYAFVPQNIRANEIVYYLATIALESMFVLAAITVAATRKVDIKKATGLTKKVNGRMVWLGFLISVTCLVFFGDITNVFIEILSLLGYTSVLSDIVIDTFWRFLAYVIISCITPAFCEEFLFRGTILSGLKQYGAKIAIIVSAIIFTFMHGNAEQTVHQFIIGLIIGFLFYKTGNFWIGVIIHFFNNFISISITYLITLIQSNSDIAQTATEVMQEITVSQVIIDLIFALIFAYCGYHIIMRLFNMILKEDESLNKVPTQNLSEQTISVDGEEQKVEMTVNGEAVSESSQTENNESKTEPEKPEQLSKGTIVMFAISGIYLMFEWLASLLLGLGVF